MTSTTRAPRWFVLGDINAFFGLMLGVMLLGRRILRRETLRRIPHLCPACAYNLTANTSGVCPECGRAIETERKPEGTASPVE